jgi:hypothetical protein
MRAISDSVSRETQGLGWYESSTKRWGSERCVHGTTATAHVVREVLPILGVYGCQVKGMHCSYAPQRQHSVQSED